MIIRINCINRILQQMPFLLVILCLPYNISAGNFCASHPGSTAALFFFKSKYPFAIDPLVAIFKCVAEYLSGRSHEFHQPSPVPLVTSRPADHRLLEREPQISPFASVVKWSSEPLFG